MVQSESLYNLSIELLCKPIVLHTSGHMNNKHQRQLKRLMLFIMVNSAKTFLNKKSHLTCDHTMREVLTTTNNINT